ncbi:autotransporter domain-containing protein [Chelativorans sp. M5D2P16]|uniref:autotransporter domain-containing protein n=1 Tax=Chelativorans sp. M5D2P16 TaxID=3095678 RepID=UPI002ACAEA1D|nr:autotransporter domain-containing protein [Chelativorans sp. M5D2P16]MDZ5699001.1 autotransporter domain-containing protein [Chelativorans sp. M5D2P16]
MNIWIGEASGIHAVKSRLLLTSTALVGGAFLAMLETSPATAQCAVTHSGTTEPSVTNATTIDCIDLTNVTVEGDVTNSGTITGAGGGTDVGISIFDSTIDGAIDNSGSISGSDNAVQISNTSIGNGITNSGSISGGDHGITMIGGSLSGGIVNAASGVIENSSTVSSHGVVRLNGLTSFTGGFVNDGTINGNYGFFLDNVVTTSGGIVNNGVMNVSGGGLVTAGASIDTITGGMTNNGTITFGTSGLSVGDAATFSGGITNTGVLEGTESWSSGIILAGVGDFSGGIDNSGSISAGTGIAVWDFGTTITTFSGGINNSGTITADTGILVEAITDSFLGGIVNSGTITAADGTGIHVEGQQNFEGGVTNTVDGEITTNSAPFFGSANGITLENIVSFTGGVTNAGVISAVENGLYINNVSSFEDPVFNAATGEITGSSGIVVSGSDSITITNAGTITGTDGTAIDLSGTSNANTIEQQDGAIDGDILLSSAADQLTVTGGDIQGDITGQGPANIDFQMGAGTFTYGAPHTISGIDNISVHSGTVQLDGASTSNTVDVLGGTLLANNTHGGDVSVANGGSLGGTGSVGDTVVADGGTLLGEAGQVLSLASLSLAPDAQVNVALSAPSTNGLFDVTGDLTLDGELNITDVGGFGDGVYRLIDYGGGLTDNGLEIGSTPGGVIAADLTVQTSVANQVNLISTAGIDFWFWDGGNAALHENNQVDGGTGVWDATNGNWTDQDGIHSGPMKPVPGFAIFQANAGNVTVDDGAGQVSVTGMQFASDGYTVGGDAVELADPDGASTIRVGDGTAAGAGFTATIASELTGANDLVKDDLGTLILTGANSYGGDTLVANGTLIGDAGSIRGDLQNAGTTVFDQAADANFTGDVSGLGGTDGSMIKRGAGTLALAGTSTLDWTVEAGGLSSSAEGFTGDVDIDTGAAFIFDQATAAAYAGIVSGDGDFSKTGGGTLTLTGNSGAFGGQTDLAGGTLVVDGTLGGALSVRSGATLGGSGTVGSTTVHSGSTLNAGGVDNVGTLKVEGDVTFQSGSVYAVDVEPGGTGSDLLDVAGQAFLGESVAHVGLDGAYDPVSVYTILTADSGVRGTFASVSSDYAFLDPLLSYDTNNVYLQLERNNIDFAAVAQTFNQRNTAQALDALGSNSAVWNAVVQLGEDEASVAFDSLSGEVHASTAGMLLDDSRFLREAVSKRVNSAFDTEATLPEPLAFGPDGVKALPGDERLVFWTSGYGSWGEREGDDNAADFDRSLGGLFLGADAQVSDNWRVGAIAGYGRSSFDADDRASSGSVNSYHLGLYGGARYGAVGVNLGTAYTWHDVETERMVDFSGFQETLSADYDASTAQAFGEINYRIETERATFEPFLGLAHVRVDTDGFRENGDAALTGDGSVDATFSTIGVRAATEFSVGETQARAHGLVGWRHAFGDTTPQFSHSFAGGDRFSVAGAPIAKDAAVLQAGIDFDLSPDATLGVSYSGQFADNVSDHGFKADFKVRF